MPEEAPIVESGAPSSRGSPRYAAEMGHHPDLERIAFLAGVWRGGGHGDYPTIDPFDYIEEIEISPLPAKPVLWYRQRTRRAGTDDPLHAESGYLRPIADGRVELALAQPTGLVETHIGDVDGTTVSLRSTLVGRTETAVEVTEVERRIRVEGDRLSYRLSMAAVGQPLQLHLDATLERAR